MKHFYRWVIFPALVLVLFNRTLIAQQHEGDMKGISLASQSSDPLTGFLEGGYVSTLNVYQGEKISFYVSTKANPFTLKVYRFGAKKEFMTEFTGLKGGVKEVKESDMVWERGCNWEPVVTDFVIPGNWRAGAYVAEFPVSSNQVTPIVFFVKEKDPGKRSRILVMASTNTWAAYNQFGGKSIYDEFSTGRVRSNKLTFHRPFNKNDHHGVNRGSFEAYESKLIYWLESFAYGKDVDVVAQHDLEFDYAYLKSHDVLIDCGHDEYWSRGIREAIERYIDGGKHFICLAGNTCWWQVRHPDQNTLVCYKTNQDIEHPNDSLTTNNWFAILGGKNRENQLLGTSYEMGGYVNYGWKEDPPPAYPGPWLGWATGFGVYAVHNAQHWVFNNTGIKEGDVFGAKGDSAIVGYEADGARFKYDEKGLPVPTGLDQTPMNYRILGISPVSIPNIEKGYDYPAPGLAATMGIYKRTKPGSGFVFNGATVRWVWGLYPATSNVSKVTKNVLDQFLSGSCPPEFTYWSPSTIIYKKQLALDMAFNSRDKDLKFGKNLTLRAEANGYNKETVSYAWAVNDTIVPEARGNSFIFRSVKYDFGENKVTAFAMTGNDTAYLSWKINSVENALAITSVPDTVIRLGQAYKYSLSHYSKYNSEVKYEPVLLPKWAKFDAATKTIEGIPNTKNDSISIVLTDAYGNRDTQSFGLKEQETTYVRSTTAVIKDFSLEQNFPNPFNNSTKIRFNVRDLSHAELVINDMLGKRIRTYSLGQVPSGSYEVSWDGADDFGLPVASGVYVYNVTFTNGLAGKVNLSKKMIYMK